VQVEDDGRGTSPNGSTAGGGNGIPGMKERATALGGRLDAGPRPGGGFRVRASLPLRDDE
jgi:signal transduction histidine kinase